MDRSQAYMSDGELNDSIESVQDDLSVATFDESFVLQEELDMLEEEEYLRTLIDADVSTLNGMSAGAIQDALKLLEAAQEANRPDQDAILAAIDLFMEKEADANKPLQRIQTDAATGDKPYAMRSAATLPSLPVEAGRDPIDEGSG